jgi:tetratricopeptide (TPR) repeat protein
VQAQHAPNDLLRAALIEAGWTLQDLASAVNAASAEAGAALRYDRRAVSHWLIGMRPRQPVRELIIEALARRLDRPVTAADVGFGPPAPGPDRGPVHQMWRPDMAAEFSRLAALHPLPGPRPRRETPSVAYNLADLAVPGWAQAADSVPHPRRLVPGLDRLGTDSAQAAESMASVMSVADAALGGGRCRRALAAYLAADLMPKLGSPMSPGLRRRMLAAVIQVSYLCAFTCFDDESHGTALCYYRSALQLSAENGDPTRYSITLRAMSMQAHCLGHTRKALQLAESATSTRMIDPGRRAFLFGQLAVAHAADHNRVKALSCLGIAERSLERSTSVHPFPIMGAYHSSALVYQRSVVQALLGDTKGAITSLTSSLRHQPTADRRSRAITTARLAELQLDLGLLDQAVSTWHDFLDYYPTLDCGRACTALATLRARARPHSRNRQAQALLQRAAELENSELR